MGDVSRSVTAFGAIRPRAVDFCAVGFSLTVAVQLWLIFNHAPWFDEAQALLVARAPWRDLIVNLRYEGHPALWYLWLGGIDRLLGGSRLALPVAQALVAIPTAGLLWFRSPFALPAKAALAFSYFFIFEYGALSRDYSLGVLLIVAAAAMRGSLWSWVCLALACNTSAHLTLAAGALGAAWFWRDERRWAGAAILAAGALAAIATVLPSPPDVHIANAITGPPLVRALAALDNLGLALVPAVPSIPYDWGNWLPIFWGIQAGLAVLALGLIALPSWPARAGYFALYAGLFGIAVLVYPLYQRHAGVLFVFVIAVLWADGERQLPLPAWLWTAGLVACATPFVLLSPFQPFGNGRQTADWIRAHGLADETWGEWPNGAGTLIAAELGRPLVNLQRGCTETFLHWNYAGEDAVDPIPRIRALGVRYVVSHIPLKGPLLAWFPAAGVASSPFYLYRFEGDHGAHVSACKY